MKVKPSFLSILLALISIASFFLPWFKIFSKASISGQTISSAFEVSPSDALVVYLPWMLLSILSLILALFKSKFAFIPSLINFYPILSFLKIFGNGFIISSNFQGGSTSAGYSLLYGFWIFAATTILFTLSIFIKKGTQGINFDFILKLFKRTAFVILSLVLLLGIIMLAFAYFKDSDKGVLRGKVNSLEEKGSVFKTFEGSILLESFGKNSIGDTFKFSIESDNEELIKQLQIALNKNETVNLNYVKKYIRIPWRGETLYLIRDIEPKHQDIDKENFTEGVLSSSERLNDFSLWLGTYQNMNGDFITLDGTRDSLTVYNIDQSKAVVEYLPDGRILIDGAEAFFSNDTLRLIMTGSSGSHESIYTQMQFDSN